MTKKARYIIYRITLIKNQYNTKDYLMFYLFGIKVSLKINEKNINKLVWWIPVRKWRDNFRSKMLNI